MRSHHLRRRQALVDELQQAGDHPEHQVGLPGRAVGEANAQVGGARMGVGGGLGTRAERRLDQRRECLNVRAQHDDVARLERRILRQRMEDRVTQHLDLAAATVTRMHLDAPVGRHRRRGLGAPVGADVGLDTPEEHVRLAGVLGRPGGAGDDRARPPQDDLQLSRVTAPRGQQRMPREG
jgi:hypothetical protein